jgi:hypothetical protein
MTHSAKASSNRVQADQLRGGRFIEARPGRFEFCRGFAALIGSANTCAQCLQARYRVFEFAELVLRSVRVRARPLPLKRPP